MLRGWIAAGVASRYVVVEPAGIPDALRLSAEIIRYTSPDELPAEPRPDAGQDRQQPRSSGDGATNSYARAGSAPADANPNREPAPPVQRGGGYRGPSRYVRPTAPRQAPLADYGDLPEDPIDFDRGALQ